ncbi:MAG: hypothetical protein FJW66_05235 [Actinobacteria bacterium]|nr:hypothetical protein [Actinomycetota bacterium]
MIFISIVFIIIIPVNAIFFGLAIAAVTCGGIDLKRVKSGISTKKGKGFDIAGIVLGGLFILFVTWFLLGEFLIPH